MDGQWTLNGIGTQAALMLDSGKFNLQANTDKIQHLLTFVRGPPLKILSTTHFNLNQIQYLP